jgi:hypothetical protein
MRPRAIDIFSDSTNLNLSSAPPLHIQCRVLTLLILARTEESALTPCRIHKPVRFVQGLAQHVSSLIPIQQFVLLVRLQSLVQLAAHYHLQATRLLLLPPRLQEEQARLHLAQVSLQVLAPHLVRVLRQVRAAHQAQARVEA